jgi:hypothetical protein
MIHGLPPIEGTPSGMDTPRIRPSGPPKLFVVGANASDQLPDLPPADVLDALDAAARVLDELDRKNVQFRVEHDASTNTIQVHVDGGDGREREIPAQRLLNILAGDTSSLSIDARG